MDIDIISHMWAAIISTIGMAAGMLALSFALHTKKNLGGVLGKAISYVTLCFACIFLLILFYFASGIYFAMNGMRYPSWASELAVSTSLSLSLIFAFLAANTMKKGAKLETQ